MKKNVDIEKMIEFGRELNSLRRQFPEYAEEIDRCFYDVGQNHAACCGKKDCACQISFAEFHEARNLNFK